jgi:hypothetical protein
MNYLPDSPNSNFYIDGSGSIPPNPNISQIEELNFVDLSKNQKFVLNYLLQFILDQNLFDSLEDKLELEHRTLSISHFEASEAKKLLNIIDRVIAFVESNQSQSNESEFNTSYLKNFKQKLNKTINQK